MRDLVSIILPTYNGSRYIHESVRSCLEQTYTSLELIVVDDASTDATPEMLESIARSDARVRILCHASNRGLPEALNTGFAAARGEYLTWTSDDNYYAGTAIAEMVSVLEERPDFGFVYADYTIFDGTSCKEIAVLDPGALVFGNIIGACFLYRKQVRDTLGPYDSRFRLAEDFDYWLRVSGSFRLATLHRNLYWYRTHAKSLGATNGEGARRAAYSALSHNLSKLKWLDRSGRADAWIGMAKKARAYGEWDRAGWYATRGILTSPWRVIGHVARILAGV